MKIRKIFLFCMSVAMALFLLVFTCRKIEPTDGALSFLFMPSMAMAYENVPDIVHNMPDKNTVLLMSAVSSVKKSNTPHPSPSPVPTVLPVPDVAFTDITISSGNTAANGVQINNETSYDLSGIVPDATKVDAGGEPTVLIVHTHTSESYRPSKEYNYTPTDVDRTEDTAFNVARVGKELSDVLAAHGIYAIHDAQINDYPSYNGSYKKSMDLITWYLERYPSIEYVFDVHRDAIVSSDGVKKAVSCEIDGQRAAQVMLVVGTDEGGLTHQNWKNNLSRAMALQKTFNEAYPDFARPVNLRRERFNGHLSDGHMIIEVGTTGNTLDEALVSARALGDCIAKCILNK